MLATRLLRVSLSLPLYLKRKSYGMVDNASNSSATQTLDNHILSYRYIYIYVHIHIYIYINIYICTIYKNVSADHLGVRAASEA